MSSESSYLLNDAKPPGHGELTPFLVFASGVAVISGLNFGYHTGVLNNPKEVMTNCSELYDPGPNAMDLPPCWLIPDALWGTIVGMFAIGGLFGGLVAGWLADRLGRKTLILYNNFFYMLGSALMAFSLNEEMLIVGRIFIGVGCGVSTVVVPMYLSECSPTNLRGAIGVLTQLSVTVGIAVAQLLGLVLSNVPGWRWLVGLSFFFCVVQILLLPLLTQTPRWLAMKERADEAKDALRKLRGYTSTRYADAEYDHIVEGQRGTTALSLKELLTTPAFRKPLAIALMLQVAQQFSGINAVFYYSTDIFNRSNPANAEILTVSIGILNVLLTVLSVFLMDRAGRKILLIVGEVGMILTGALYTISFALDVPWLSILCTYVYVAAFAVGLGPIPWLIISEIFPTNAVGTAASLAVPTNWLCNYLVGQFFPLMSDGLGDYAFLPFAGILFLALIFTVKVVPETKGRTLEEITAELS